MAAVALAFGLSNGSEVLPRLLAGAGEEQLARVLGPTGGRRVKPRRSVQQRRAEPTLLMRLADSRVSESARNLSPGHCPHAVPGFARGLLVCDARRHYGDRRTVATDPEPERGRAARSFRESRRAGGRSLSAGSCRWCLEQHACRNRSISNRVICLPGRGRLVRFSLGLKARASVPRPHLLADWIGGYEESGAGQSRVKCPRARRT
jgi:hypothetical protein